MKRSLFHKNLGVACFKNTLLIVMMTIMGNIKNLKNFKKGQSGNPAGRPPDALNRVMKKLTKNELEEIANLIVKGTVAELKKIAQSKNTQALRVMFAAIVVKIIERGDMDAFDKLLNRLIGKVKDDVDITSNAGTPTVIVNLPNNGKAADVI